MTKEGKRTQTTKQQQKMDKFELPHSSPSLSHRLLTLLFCLLILSGCASLPRFEEFYYRLDVKKEETPKIIGPHGPLSPRVSAKVMERLKKNTGPTDILDRHIALIESIGGSPLVAGNKVTLLIDGPATYEAMFRAIQRAKDHINLETYIFEDGEAGHRFADLLLQKQSEGVQVNPEFHSLDHLLFCTGQPKREGLSGCCPAQRGRKDHPSRDQR